MIPSLLIGKITLKLIRLLGRTGSALPGLIVEKLDSKVLQKTIGKLEGGIIVVTGTNGKTTTTKVITKLLESQGLRVLTNQTGSNFVRGVISVVIERASLAGKLDYDVAVIEQDEAHAVHFVKKVKPRGVVALNVMRDQMDRFGEIDKTKQLIEKAVKAASDWTVLNSNDERVAAIKPSKGVETLWYGYDQLLFKNFLSDDQLYDKNLKYYNAGQQLVSLVDYADGEVTLQVADKARSFEYLLGGGHNAINLAAALAVLVKLVPNYDVSRLSDAIKSIEPAFGRGEVITLQNGTELTIQLIKNPGGFMHALRMLDVKKYYIVGIAINDEYADGRDVSWLWDVDFSGINKKVRRIVCGGSRGHDMAVRLKYDLVPPEPTQPELEKFVGSVNSLSEKYGKKAIVFCTYTAMLELRQVYKKYSKDVYEVKV